MKAFRSTLPPIAEHGLDSRMDFPRKRPCHGRQGDSMSELLEAMDVVMRETLGRQPVEMIYAEIAIGNGFAQNVIGGHEDAVANGDRRLFLTAAPAQTRVLNAEIGTAGTTSSQPHSTSIGLSHRLPLRVLPVFRLPALSLFPGQTPAHEARCAADGNRLMSTPISAMIVSAASRPTPGIVCRRAT